ncbi:GGDEF domain-containing response regulator [Desulfogranum japonicum]|uniref:GGDEF domain-containing response regulator n=1 Tax=Desulfogranum japonicum TaxID=231447 RepID=UPI000427725D|nr:diguanylate cyclase [Desulfogranum japonicum]
MKRDPSTQTAILCVDDEPIVTESLRTLFLQELKNVTIIEVAHSADEAMEVIEEFIEDRIEVLVVISDYIMPGTKGDELLAQIHAVLPKTKKIMLTGQSDIKGIRHAINKARLYRFLEKPWMNDDMVLTISGAITSYRQEVLLEQQNQELVKLNQELEEKVKARTRELEEKNRELEQIAIRDRLTGLFNRRKLDEVLATEIARSERYGNQFGVILIDIDHFKNVNDMHGHQVGDLVLQLFAAQLCQSVRQVDVLGRWGGEEFLVICPETKQEGLFSLAQKLRKKVLEKYISEVGPKTASFGVAIFEEGDTAASIVEKADKALYRAKEKGRNRVEI